jgi:hypothetical protein
LKNINPMLILGIISGVGCLHTLFLPETQGKPSPYNILEIQEG